jgi:hypothetical protein
VTRDLARLTELGLLEPHGQTCGRYYVAPASSLPSGIRSAGSARHWLTPYPLILTCWPTFAGPSWRSRSVADSRRSVDKL